MPQVDLQAYRYFCAVADTGSVRAAADLCFVTQPAVSRQIALMERTLGVRLFNRRSSGMEITAVGQALYPEAQRLLSQADRANRMLEFWKGAGTGLRVACLDTTLNLIIAPFIAETGTPIVDVRTERAKDLDTTLDAGVDLVVSTAPAPRSRAVRRLCNVPLAAQYGEKVQLAGDDAVELAVLADYGLLLPGHGSAVERSVRSAAADAGIELTVVSVVSSGRVAQAIAAARSVVAITVEPPSFGLRSVALISQGKPQTVALYASWDVHHPASRAIESCVASLERWLTTRRPWAGHGQAGESTSATELSNE